MQDVMIGSVKMLTLSSFIEMCVWDVHDLELSTEGKFIPEYPLWPSKQQVSQIILHRAERCKWGLDSSLQVDVPWQ